MGAKVKKGAKGAMVTFWKILYFDATSNRPLSEAEGKRREAEAPKTVKVVPLLRYFTVFNIADCEEVPETVLKKYGIGADPTQPELELERPAVDPNIAWLMDLAGASGVRTSFGGDSACYYPSRDLVLSPPLDAYNTIEDGFATLAHEYGHATGHPGRLNRNMHGRFGDPAYAYEELVAEMTAGFICGIRGVTGKLQHVEYIHSWMTRMKADPKEVFKAAKAAQDATEFLLGERKAKAEEGTPIAEAVMEAPVSAAA
jgi:antirestriction protein ArdC